MTASSVSADGSGTGVRMVLPNSRSTPAKDPGSRVQSAAILLSPAEAAFMYLHNLTRTPELFGRGVNEEEHGAAAELRLVSHSWCGGLTEERINLNKSTENNRDRA